MLFWSKQNCLLKRLKWWDPCTWPQSEIASTGNLLFVANISKMFLKGSTIVFGGAELELPVQSIFVWLSDKNHVSCGQITPVRKCSDCNVERYDFPGFLRTLNNSGWGCGPRIGSATLCYGPFSKKYKPNRHPSHLTESSLVSSSVISAP